MNDYAQHMIELRKLLNSLGDSMLHNKSGAETIIQAMRYRLQKLEEYVAAKKTKANPA